AMTAGNVLIVDVGFSNELPIGLLAFLAMVSIGAIFAGHDYLDKIGEHMCELIRSGKSKEPAYGPSLPSAKTLFTDNQCVLDLVYEPPSQPLSSVMIISTDDVAFNDNQSDCDESQQQTM